MSNMTGANGLVEFQNIPLGKIYDMVEVQFPNGYVKLDGIVQIKTGADGKVTIGDDKTTVDRNFVTASAQGLSARSNDNTIVDRNFQYYNIPIAKASVTLQKLDKANSHALQNAEFELWRTTTSSAIWLNIDESGMKTTSPSAFTLEDEFVAMTTSGSAFGFQSIAPEKVGTFKTNIQGFISLENLPGRDYYFIEIKAPDGYQMDADNRRDFIWKYNKDTAEILTPVFNNKIIPVPPPQPPPPQPPPPPPIPPVDPPKQPDVDPPKSEIKERESKIVTEEPIAVLQPVVVPDEMKLLDEIISQTNEVTEMDDENVSKAMPKLPKTNGIASELLGLAGLALLGLGVYGRRKR